jgi:predicted amidohydrolase
VVRGRRTWLVAGFPEQAGDRLYNSAMVLDREGRLAFVYRKTLLYDDDLHWAEPGDRGYATFDTGAGTFGVGICMDLNDDRFLAWWRDADPDAVAFPTNWLRDPEGLDAWGYWAWRTQGLRGALVAADTWGFEGGTGFEGRSCVLRQAAVHAWLPPEGDGWARASIPTAGSAGLVTPPGSRG